ncbi:sulfatase-like hydrolase/transferase [Stenotrophomonas lactitubi]|uniref:sulfatase-like hydrolase/transferase n=1 Tax=Stenotrophomonas lactitubi TaxID=2045214 RepID=UPI00320860F6
MRQYVAAAMTGLMLLGGQIYQMALRFGVEGLHPRSDLMQRQIASELMSQPGFIAAIASFALFAIVSHLLLTVGAMWVYRRACVLTMPARRDAFWYSMFFVTAAVMLAMFANRWLFPLSASVTSVELLMVQRLSPLLIGGCIVVVVGALLVSLYSLLRRRRALVVGASVIMLVIGLGAWGKNEGVREDAGRRNPDVIILGVDSLRPDYLSSYGEFPGDLAPSIEKALSSAVVMDDVRTPLARTFVSYNSTLTGMNPIKHGARFNLYPRTEFSRDKNLAWELKKSGYFTMLAMDESRFANFDQSFGFDRTVTPVVGAIDFVVGGSFDFVATNLVLAALPASDLLSAIQGNRAAYRSYRSVDHTQRVIAGLRRVPTSSPLFLVSHLCLPHWPYLPGKVTEDNSLGWVGKLHGYEDSSSQYLNAVKEADRQFDSLIQELRRLKRLDNAILIIMSDHGEDFAMKRDLLNVAGTGERVGYYGHGSFALSDVQNHVVMGIQRFRNGLPVWQHRRVYGAGSLIDVAPTIADLVGLDVGRYEGISWLSSIRNHQDLPFGRIRFVENGLRSAGVERAHINEHEVAQEMSYLYRITKDGRFEIRPELLPGKLRGKQRGALLGKLGVMTDPVSDNAPGAAGCWRVVDYEKRTIGCTGFPSSEPDVAKLQHAVCEYYRQEEGFENAWCRGGGAAAFQPPISSS